ncbi:MAG TPA: FxSxx-COOH system tetratricopeptide repeat protein [Candidatus Limnocylindrales bacterium]
MTTVPEPVPEQVPEQVPEPVSEPVSEPRRPELARRGRPETRLAGDGPLHRFASELRRLRQTQQLTVRQVAEAMHYSASVVSRMASGRELPSWELTQCFVQACSGDVARWRRLWADTAEALSRQAPASRGGPRAQAQPEAVASHVEFLAELRLRISQKPAASYRWLARRTGYPHSTIAAAISESAPRLPKWRLVAKVLSVLGDDEFRIAVWHAVWERLQDKPSGGEPERVAMACDPAVAPPLGLLDPARRVRGRAKLIEQMVELTNGNRSKADTGIHILHGTGGAGKTMVALEVAIAVAHRGTRVWWVSAAEPASLVEGMTTVAREVGASEEELQRSDPADAFWRRLMNERERWLLVLDGVDDPAVLDTRHGGLIDRGTGWIRPAAAQGLILVTSRFRRWPNWCRRHEVSELNIEDAAQVLLDYCGERAGRVEDAEELAEGLGRLPLMLKLAGAFLARTANAPLPDPSAPTTFADYLRKFKAMEVPAAESGEMVDEIQRVWDLSLELLTRRGMPDAHELLRLLVTFADAPIPFRLLFTADSLRDANLTQPTMPSVSNLLESLSQVSLINLDTATDQAHLAKLHIHPLVRTAGRMHPYTIERASKYVASAVNLISRACAELPPEHPPNWPAWGLIAPHALHLLQTARRTGEPEDLVRKAGHAAAQSIRWMIARGDFHNAVRQLRTLLAIAQEVFGDEDSDTLRIMHEQATALRKTGQYQEAELTVRAAWEVSARLRGEEHELTLDLRRDLAIVHLELGRYREAESALREVSELRRRMLGEQHPETLSTVHALARVLCELGRYQPAHKLFVEVYEARLRILGPEHPDTLTTLRNVARVLDDLGCFGDAEKIYAGLHEISIRVLGLEHPDTLLARFDLAKNCLYQGLYRAAEAEFQRVLEARRRILGDEHPRTLTARRYLAMALHALALWDEAQAQYEMVYSCRLELLGEMHPHTLSARFSLAILRRDRGEFQWAHNELQDIHRMQVELLGEDHKETLSTWHELAMASWELGRYDEAEAVLTQVFRKRSEVLGPKHPDTLRGRRDRAGLLMARDRNGDALVEHREVYQLCRETLGEEHPDTLKARSELARLYRYMRDNKGAKRELEAVFEVHSRVLGPGHPDTITTQRILARILHDDGLLDEAEKAYSDVLMGRAKLYGRNHPYTLIAFNNLGLVYIDKGLLAQAELQLRTVYQARVRLLGSEHPDTLATRHDLASVLHKLGRVEEAGLELAGVLQARTRLLGPQHRDTAATETALRSVTARVPPMERVNLLATLLE